MLYNGCTGIYKFGNNTYPRRIRHRSNLGRFFWGKKKVRHMGQEIWYFCTFNSLLIFSVKIKGNFLGHFSEKKVFYEARNMVNVS
jgi:hypothetical protein